MTDEGRWCLWLPRVGNVAVETTLTIGEVGQKPKTNVVP